MPMTLREVVEYLKQVDEISLMEMLDISSEELAERFIDKIEDRLEKLQEDLEETDYDN